MRRPNKNLDLMLDNLTVVEDTEKSVISVEETEDVDHEMYDAEQDSTGARHEAVSPSVSLLSDPAPSRLVVEEEERSLVKTLPLLKVPQGTMDKKGKYLEIWRMMKKIG